MITKREAYWTNGICFPTEDKATEFEKIKQRLDSFQNSLGINDPIAAKALYDQFLSSLMKRTNFRKWLDTLDRIG